MPTVVLGVTGCIGAYKACEVLRELQKRGADVHVVMTRNAARFVAPMTLEALSRHPVFLDQFALGEAGETDLVSGVIVVAANVPTSENLECPMADFPTRAIVLIEGMAARLMSGLAFTVVLSLLVSLAVAVLLIPALSVWLLPRDRTHDVNPGGERV